MADEIDLIRTRINIIDLVSQRTALKKAGRSYKALCPFHDDRNPSMTVNPELGRYRCWSCGASGDIFNWVMETQKVDFGEALKLLAAQAGVELKAGKREPGQSMKATHEEMMRAAQAFFIKQLELSQTAKTYCAQRGLEPGILEAWGIGYGPEEGSALAVSLRKQGFSLSEAQALFLVDQDSGGGYYDRFRGRLVIPIQDERGRVVAFGGRIIGAGQPKYINSSDTPLYHKSDLLFGMHKAKESMAKLGRAVLVEGYMDVIACHRAGMTEAVASLGTALTAQQVKLMKRWAGQVIVLYDRDEAGQKAAEKACEMLAEEGVIARVALPPIGEDPDSLLTKKGAAGVLALIDDSVSPIRHRLMRLDEKKKPTDPGYWDEVADALAQARNHVELEEHLAPLVPLVPNQPDRAAARSVLLSFVRGARKKVPRVAEQVPPSALESETGWKAERLLRSLSGAERVLLKALLVDSLRGVAWRVLQEERVFREGLADRVRNSLIGTFPDGLPNTQGLSWLSQVKDREVVQLITELAEEEELMAQVTREAVEAWSTITPAILEESIIKLAKQRAARSVQEALQQRPSLNPTTAHLTDEELRRINLVHRHRGGRVEDQD